MAFRAAALAGLLAVGLVGCGHKGPVLPASAVAFNNDISVYQMGPGDTLRLSLYGDPNFAGEFRVGADGNLSLPLIGATRAQGRTVEQVRQDIQRQLADGYYKDPRVSAEITAFRPFYILGEVQRPGAYPYVPGLTLAQAVATAGGYSYRASTSVVAVDTPDSPKEVVVRADQAMPIGPLFTVRILERTF